MYGMSPRMGYRVGPPRMRPVAVPVPVPVPVPMAPPIMGRPAGYYDPRFAYPPPPPMYYDPRLTPRHMMPPPPPPPYGFRRPGPRRPW